MATKNLNKQTGEENENTYRYTASTDKKYDEVEYFCHKA